MKRQRITLIITVLFLAIIFPVTAMYLCRIYTINVSNGLELLFLLAIIVGGITPSLILSWLILISVLIVIGFLFLGDVIIPTPAKISLLIAFPIEASLVNVISNYIIPWSFIVGKNKKIRNFLSHYDFALNLQTTYSAKKLYRHHIKILQEHPELKLNTNLMMIHWTNHEQFKELHPREYEILLNQMAKIFKNKRLTEEFIYYLGNATFLINSPNLDPHIFEKINQDTEEALFQMPEPIPTHLKIANLFVDSSNVNKYNTPEKMLKHLERELETTLIVEYLKEKTDE